MEDQATQSTPRHPQTRQPPMDLGIYRRQEASARITATEGVAIALSLIWIAGVGAFFYFTQSASEPLDSLRFVMTLLAIFLPVALVWVAATAARSSRIMRQEAQRLEVAIDAMRQLYFETQQTGMGVKPSVERKLEEIAVAQRRTQSALATFTSIRPDITPMTEDAPAIATPSTPDEQGRLELGTTAEEIGAPVNVSDFVKALNFPENAEDKEGFRALRRALQDRQTAELVRSSQDVLTMLSQDGIYMDDLRPDKARPEIWRKFAQGERGRAIAGLGGVRDRSCLALTAARMREDPIFRDAAHHFLRRFDKTFSAFEANASDPDVAALSDTRTARAFMLLGRVTGTFT